MLLTKYCLQHDRCIYMKRCVVLAGAKCDRDICSSVHCGQGMELADGDKDNIGIQSAYQTGRKAMLHRYQSDERVASS